MAPLRFLRRLPPAVRAAEEAPVKMLERPKAEAGGLLWGLGLRSRKEAMKAPSPWSSSSVAGAAAVALVGSSGKEVGGASCEDGGDVVGGLVVVVVVSDGALYCGVGWAVWAD